LEIKRGSTQFEAKAFLIDGLEQPRPERSMHRDSQPNHLLSQPAITIHDTLGGPLWSLVFSVWNLKI
jgi:hypothetical protein